MKKMNQKGFTAHLMLIIAAVAVVVGAAGYAVYHKNKANAYFINAYGCHSTPILSLGSSGPCVTAVQHILNDTHCFTKIAIDGQYGPITKKTVIAYQKDGSLTANGIVGPSTWSFMLNPKKGLVCISG